MNTVPYYDRIPKTKPQPKVEVATPEGQTLDLAEFVEDNKPGAKISG